MTAEIEATFLFIIEVLGTIAFAISGIRLAAVKRFDWFGAYIVGLVAVTAISLAVVLIFRRKAWIRERTLFIFDTIGLAVFVVIGIQKTLATGYPMWVAIVMGVITGAFGGVVRDILINEEPLVFRRDIYAMACVAGGLVYSIFYAFGATPMLQQTVCALVVMGLRGLAVIFNWHLPVMSDIAMPETNKTENRKNTDS